MLIKLEKKIDVYQHRPELTYDSGSHEILHFREFAVLNTSEFKSIIYSATKQQRWDLDLCGKNIEK